MKHDITIALILLLGPAMCLAQLKSASSKQSPAIAKTPASGQVTAAQKADKTGKEQPKLEFGLRRPVVRIQPVDETRVKKIAAILTDKPKGLGETYHNRQAWEELKAKVPAYKYKRLIAQADKYLTMPYPEWDNPRYMRMFTHGDSQSGKDLLTERFVWLPALVWAECYENNGKYMATIEKVLNEMMSQETWVYPRNYRKETAGSTVELNTSRYAHNIAQALYLLDDKFSPEFRQKVIGQLYTRAFDPVLRTVTGKDTFQKWWIEAQNNWNSVCLAGVTGAALAVIPDKTERARFIAIAERYTPNFINGYGDDGYCPEGMSYYTYGFSNYIVLRENIMQATGGKLDIFAQNPKLEIMTLYPLNIEITPKVYPTIADCDPHPKAPPVVLGYMSKVLGLGLEYESYSMVGNHSSLVRDLFDVFPNYQSRMKGGKHNFKPAPLRYYFFESGILVSHNTPGLSPIMGVAAKGGDNNESHNHNDLGSFTLVVGKEPMVEDPGLIAYTAKMSTDRYSYLTLSSYGHPVPLIGGHQQAVGKQAKAKVFQTRFSPEMDMISMDITSAYADSVPGIRSLVREFEFHRGRKPALVVTDSFKFDTPQTFETAIITRGEWKLLPKDRIEIIRGDSRIIAAISAPEGGVTVTEEWIDEDGGKRGKPYHRLAVKANRPVTEGEMSITYMYAD